MLRCIVTCVYGGTRVLLRKSDVLDSAVGSAISGNSMKMSCPSLSSAVEWFSSRCAVTVSRTYEGTSTLNMRAREMLSGRSRSSRAGGTEAVSSMSSLRACLRGSLRYVVSEIII